MFYGYYLEPGTGFFLIIPTRVVISSNPSCMRFQLQENTAHPNTTRDEITNLDQVAILVKGSNMRAVQEPATICST
jgi:hypothetical protein